MRVAEKFISINGEGSRAGELAAFIRFTGCNLRCSYCDTSWANAPDCPFVEETPEEIAEWVKASGIRDVTLTGGEPLLQEEMPELLHLLKRCLDVSVEVETNGSVDLTRFAGEDRPLFTLDYKLPSSGCERAMVLENYAVLQPEDTVKFVTGSEKDLEKAREIIEKYRLTGKCHVFLSPVFGKIRLESMVEYMADHHMNGVRLQLQLHKIIWDPERRGV